MTYFAEMWTVALKEFQWPALKSLRANKKKLFSFLYVTLDVTICNHTQWRTGSTGWNANRKKHSVSKNYSSL